MGFSPTSDTALSRPDLGLLAWEFRETAPDMGFIGNLVFPTFSVTSDSMSYPVLPAEVMLGLYNVDRAMRSKYNRSDWEFEEGFYKTAEKGWEELIDDRERKLYSAKFAGDVIAMRRAMKIIMRAYEAVVAAKVFNSTKFTTTAITHEWDDPTNAVPITNINDAVERAIVVSGVKPNSVVMNRKVFKNATRTDQVLDQLVTTFNDLDKNRIRPDQLAQIFDVDQVIVAGAVYNSANKGQAVSVSNMWSDEYVCVTNVATDVMDFETPAIGRTFLWSQDSPEMLNTEEYRDEERRSDVFRVRHDIDVSYMQSFDEDLVIKSDISKAVTQLLSNATT